MIFRFPGGKSKKSVRERILAKAPKGFHENYNEWAFREPFIGGGGIFFGIPLTVSRWINDVDINLISVYKALKERPQEFIDACRNIEPAKKDEPLTSSRPEVKNYGMLV